MSIEVPERGSVEIDGRTWRQLAQDDHFWKLVNRKIVAVEVLASGRVRLNGTSYVGRTAAGGDNLNFVEKVPGALAGLISFATRSAFKIQPVPAPASPLGPLISMLVKQFVSSVREYAADGREFTYARSPVEASMGGGKLDVTATVRLRSRGLGHLLAFDRDRISHVTDKNRVVTAALRQVEVLGRSWELDERDVLRSRAIDELFADCRDVEVLYGHRETFVRLAEQLLANPMERNQDLLLLASVILAHESFELESGQSGRTVPRSWFLNLETLFERAVRIVLGKVTPGGVHVRKGKGSENPVFPEAGLVEASPDLVLSVNGIVPAVGDVKYKNLDGSPEASDLYQLLVHAKTYGTDTAFLVYPGADEAHEDLGVATTGCRVHIFTANPSNLEHDLAAAVAELGI